MTVFKFRQQNYIFRFRSGFFMLCLFLFVLCCVLGVWQIKRYEYKKDLLNSWQQQLSAKPVVLSQLIKRNEDLQFQHVAIVGRYLNDLTMFVQNQIYQNKVGYEVLTPLQIAGEKKLLLIDRGWIEAAPTANNSSLPQIAKVTGQQTIIGHIKLLNEYQFILGDNILQPTKKPVVMQKIDVPALEKITQQQFYPFLLRLDATQAHGFVRDWVITNVIPQRHMAYAVQWFALALVLLIAFLAFCCERVEKKK